MNKAKLIIANSENDSNMYYAVGILIPDDFIYLEKNKKKIIYVDNLEFNRAKKEAKVDEVINYSNYDKKANRSSLSNPLISILKENKIREVAVPENFKMKYAEVLLKNKIKIQVKPEPFFKKRIIKNRNEIAKIKKTQRAVESTVRKTIGIIKKSKIRKDKKLIYQGKILTSEFIKDIITIDLFKNNCRVEIFNIVSCGEDSTDPHQEGAGNVVTVEPGLYYPDIGGVRIEDLILVTEKGHQNLTKFPKILEM